MPLYMAIISGIRVPVFIMLCDHMKLVDCVIGAHNIQLKMAMPHREPYEDYSMSNSSLK